MGKDQFLAILPYISADLVGMIAEKQNIPEREAVLKLYNSGLYAILEKEETKLWQYSTEMLYFLFDEERKTGIIKYPDV